MKALLSRIPAAANESLLDILPVGHLIGALDVQIADSRLDGVLLVVRGGEAEVDGAVAEGHGGAEVLV